MRDCVRDFALVRINQDFAPAASLAKVAETLGRWQYARLQMGQA